MIKYFPTWTQYGIKQIVELYVSEYLNDREIYEGMRLVFRFLLAKIFKWTVFRFLLAKIFVNSAWLSVLDF